MRRNPDKFKPKLEKEELPKKETYEKLRESRIEEFEVGENKTEAYYTGRERYDTHIEMPLWEIADIKVITKDDKNFEFSSLLPQKWSFAEAEGDPYLIEKNIGGKAWVQLWSKEVVLPKLWRKIERHYFIKEDEELPQSYHDKEGGRDVNSIGSIGEIIEWKYLKTLSQPEALLTLLHEIGHSHQKVPKEYHEMKEIMEEKEKQGEVLSIKERKLYWKYVMNIERDAFAYALHQYRKLKKEGIDILPLATSNQDISEIVRKHLSATLRESQPYHFLPKETLRELKKREKTIIQKVLERLGLEKIFGE